MSTCEDKRETLCPGDHLYGIHKQTGKEEEFILHQHRHTHVQPLLIECITRELGWTTTLQDGRSAKVNSLRRGATLSTIRSGLDSPYACFDLRIDQQGDISCEVREPKP